MTRHLYFPIAIIVFLIDRMTKDLVADRLPLHQPWSIIPSLLDLTHTHNTGVAFSFFANSESYWVPYVLTSVSALALVVILFYYCRQSAGNWRTQLGLMLVLGGAAGNLYDRVRYGFVIDFIDVYYRSYHWPTFNVADSSISVGIGLLLLEVLLQKPHASEEKALSFRKE